jgi:hypothetical protein
MFKLGLDLVRVLQIGGLLGGVGELGIREGAVREQDVDTRRWCR